ncbi:MAG: hypothetical protein HY744_18325 [Deltaproteobacteria bacterium]|nr:hypothetical protein [Deltaproteobacteria bacterium]
MGPPYRYHPWVAGEARAKKHKDGRLARCRVISLCAALLGCGCAASGARPDGNGDGAASAAGGAGAGAGTGAGATGAGGGLSVDGGGTGAGGPGEPEIKEVYGHSPNVLYKLEPETKAVTVVGSFQGCSSVIDLAINKKNEIYATTFGGLYRIDKQTAACTLIQQGSYPNSLSFVPEGTLDPKVEALVGCNGSSYVRIDEQSGQVTPIGSLPGGFSSSGDIVSVIGGGTYLTVKGPNCDDCLVEIDPKKGAIVKNYGSLGYTDVFGLAYWGGSAYGFSNGGKLFQIAFSGNAISTSLIPVPNAPPDLQFWGAGSSTAVPLEPPK